MFDDEVREQIFAKSELQKIDLMTRQKLIERLGESDYSAKSIYFLAIQNSNP